MFNLLFGTKEEVMLYFLYMMSDGEITYSEEKLFDQICSEMYLEPNAKKEAIEECLKLAKRPEDAFDIIISEKLDESVCESRFRRQNTEVSLSRIIWNLINLGYADTVFSQSEQTIINYLMKRWKIKEELYQEMISTADTMLSLTQHKDWIKKTYHNGTDRDAYEKRIDQEIQELFSDIKLSIAELAM